MRITCCLCLAIFTLAALADGPGDNLPEKVRPVPPVGIAVPEEEQAALARGLESLGAELASLAKEGSKNPALAELLPDVEIFHKAVRYALKHNEFYLPNEIKLAKSLLEMGRDRARQLRDGKPSWVTATGLVVRGYRSRIDGSVQPYGLIVPDSYRPSMGSHRLDVWLHGRGEKLTEVSFLGQRLRDRGPVTPRGAFVLHPYGRYCNAFKFAGEIDVLEALEHVRKHYPIDANRLVMRGFSMGGAGCWQFAVHFPDRWVAAAPGAGFSETPRFLDVFQKEKLAPAAYEKKLWRLYDCDGYALNLANLPTIAYSGEKDSQKQAADVMALALQREGIDLVHLIGPGTGHSYHPAVKADLDRRIDHLASLGRPAVPPVVRFTTYTLRYNRSYWVRLDRLVNHWEKATIEAAIMPPWRGIGVKTDNIERFTLTFGPRECELPLARKLLVRIDEQLVAGPSVGSDGSWTASFEKSDGKWRLASAEDTGLVKRHGLQGPIDDAFLDSFLFVRPTGKGQHAATSTWVQAEMGRAADQWRKQFRGEVRIKDDDAVTDADLAAHHIVLWGDPGSNKLLARLLPKLPLQWDATSVKMGPTTLDAAHHVPILIYPNPLNPKRYVVLNSGFTFREYDQLNNARQVPKLPDYALIDVRTPPSSRWPGKVVLADFFNERWQLPATK
ncbi:MAG: prolyl oligopeptidase family serine peptidase [Gemmataceae bacterium]